MSACFTYTYQERPTFVQILDRLSPHLPPDLLRRSFYTCGLAPEDEVDVDAGQLRPSQPHASNGICTEESSIPLQTFNSANDDPEGLVTVSLRSAEA